MIKLDPSTSAGIFMVVLTACSVMGCSTSEPPTLLSDSPLRSMTVDVDGRRVHWVEAGLDAGPSTPTLVFVHGSPGSWTAWRAYLVDPDLRARARLIAVDRPGFGGSGRGRVETSLRRQAAAVAAVLDRGEHGPTLIIGHSYGGPVAGQLAVDRPELVQSLLLIAPSVDPELEKIRWFNRLGVLFSWLIGKDLRTSNREILPLKQELELLAPHWPELRQRTVVLQGLADKLVPAGNADFLEHRLAGESHIRRLPEAGHLIPWRRPELVRQALHEWLGGIPSDLPPSTGDGQHP